MKFLTEINSLEIAIACLAVGVAAFAVRRGRLAGEEGGAEELGLAGPPVFVAGLFLLMALLLSVSEATQFMTLDEAAVGQVLRDPADRNIASNWSQGASHTANLLWVPYTRALQALSVRSETIDASLKAIHWLVGVGLIACIIANLLALMAVPVREKLWHAMALAGVLLSLPVSNLALKTLNYDSISLFGSSLAIVLVARGHREADAKMFWVAIVVGALAAQEKLNASLVLLAVCFMVGVFQGAKSRRRPMVEAALAALKALGIALGVSLASYAIAAIGLIGDPALQALMKTAPLFMEPLIIWIYAPLRFVLGIGNTIADPFARYWYAWVATALTVVLLPASAALGARLLTAMTPLSPSRVGPFVFPLGVLFIIVAGPLGLLSVTPSWAPMVPLHPSMATMGVLNGVQLHFGEQSAAMHRIAAVAFAYGVFFAAFPTALLVAAGVTALKVAWKPRSADVLDFIFAVAVATPGLLALLNTPTFNRYLSLPIVLAAIVMTVRIVDAWWPSVAPRRWGLLALPAVLALIIAEVAPFRPLYAAFRPITVEYGDRDRPVPGHLNFSWTGWGEEAILAGKFLARECENQGRLAGIACSDIGIWSVYTGKWFPTSRMAVHQDGAGFLLDDKWSGKPDTYYVLNRQLFVGGLLKDFPEISPDVVIRYRGFAIAWVYRGDRLKTSGYRFIWGP